MPLAAAMADNTLAVGNVSSEAEVTLENGVPEVFHSFGSQAAGYPAGLKTVPGPSGPENRSASSCSP